MQLPPAVVIGSTPLPALGTPIDKYPGNTQSIRPRDTHNQNLLTIPDQLYRNFGSVNINGNQGNPWQNDLTYRGFLASPWPAAPSASRCTWTACASTTGSATPSTGISFPSRPSPASTSFPAPTHLRAEHPGGALAVRTKRGFDFPGAKLEVYGARSGAGPSTRRTAAPGAVRLVSQLHRHQRERLAGQSPSDLHQLFTKAGYKTDRTDAGAELVYANNDLTGNGLVPQSLVAGDRRAVYTFPDKTKNLCTLSTAGPVAGSPMTCSSRQRVLPPLRAQT